MRSEVPDANSLQLLRLRRNALGHESATDALWDELDNAIPTVEAALMQLQLVTERPHLEFYGERTPLEPEHPEHLFGFRYEWGLKNLDGEWSLKMESTSWVHRDGQ